MGARIAAEVFPPGEFLKDELEARGWTQAEFAEIIGKDTRLVSEVMSGKRIVTPETAVALGHALGTGPELWMNLESQYQLSKVRSAGENSIARKAKLHSKFPVREMVKRGWIETSKNIDILEAQLLAFFGISSIDETPGFSHAAKKQSYDDTSTLQIAWLFRARALSQAAPVQKYSESKLKRVFEELKELTEFVDGARSVASILANAGIRFVVLESLPGCKIDGACFWLDKSSPVIAMSLRFDRVDNFWHTLFHELDHILHREGMNEPILDIDIQNDEEKPANEIRANEAAAESLIPRAELEGFIARVSPMFSDESIIGFARRMRVHPGIVVGQLQNRRLLPWSFHRKKLEKIREFVVGSALTDGFGRMIEIS
ncbi:HigA family addiction module antidote protein [Duganella sp. FT3S]|uniref:HigA family addiction module antidote protein n=1 Tax=Rugamonas fusca TaxID=2758568 RepID=A0A7W2I651_9BURK|nr:HigA family addiction module antitoxin [Rugamonas fusca]MBA5604953.1 HigA family addiction module antidote protein [Rugamonas fusca]